ncbi:MAG: hypothetical protein P9E88_05330 [Candidatus Competibacter sp.]|nr:hypothetical protein [Candidatus Competibacter sp.]
MARKADPDEIRKIVAFDRETWTALHLLALDRMASFQELADEAFRDLLAKHHRPTDLREALRASAPQTAANIPPGQTGRSKR